MKSLYSCFAPAVKISKFYWILAFSYLCSCSIWWMSKMNILVILRKGEKEREKKRNLHLVGSFECSKHSPECFHALTRRWHSCYFDIMCLGKKKSGTLVSYSLSNIYFDYLNKDVWDSTNGYNGPLLTLFLHQPQWFPEVLTCCCWGDDSGSSSGLLIKIASILSVDAVKQIYRNPT